MSTSRRMGIALAGVVAGVLLTAGCAAGQHAQTADVKPGIDGTQGKAGKILLEGVALHAPDGASYAKGANASMAITIVNNGTSPDTLVGVSSSSFAGWGIAPNADADTSSPSSTGVTIPAGSAVRLGLAAVGGSAEESTQTLVVTVLEQQLFPGNAVDVTFRFARSGSTELRVPVALSDSADDGATIPAGSESDAA